VNASSFKNYSRIIDDKIQITTNYYLGVVGEGFKYLEYNSGASESILSNILHRFIQGEFVQLIAPKNEHPNAENLIESLGNFGCDIVRVKTDMFGRIIKEFDSQIDFKKSSLLYTSYVNGYTGELQDLKWFSELKDEFSQAKFIIDVTQVFGKIKSLNCFGANEIFCSAHKFGGPKGFGIRFSREPIEVIGLGQRRPGTLNVPAIMASSVALEEALTRDWKVELEEKLEKMFLPVEPIGSNNHSGLIKIFGCHELSTIEFVTKFPKTIVGFGTACSSGVINPPIIYKKLCKENGFKSVIRVS